jgi:hypothetical protein
MKICDRCFEEYVDEEIVNFKQFPEHWICIPCEAEFHREYYNFMNKFMYQHERSKREDFCDQEMRYSERDGKKLKKRSAQTVGDSGITQEYRHKLV